jgi:hypothetical protein
MYNVYTLVRMHNEYNPPHEPHKQIHAPNNLPANINAKQMFSHLDAVLLSAHDFENM